MQIAPRLCQNGINRCERLHRRNTSRRNRGRLGRENAVLHHFGCGLASLMNSDDLEEWAYAFVAAWIIFSFLRALLDGLMTL